MYKAKHWHIENEKVRCTLCPNQCLIPEGGVGICRVRKNRNNTLYSLVYGLSTGASPDPIEKKPLYHFYPGSIVLSYGTVGCNLRCAHCQNYLSSQASIDECYLRETTIEEISILAKKYDCRGVAWTYNEPTIWFEFTLDGCIYAKKHGLYTVYVTNGYINETPLKEIAPYLDAMNIDVKAFRDDFYRKVSKGHLEPVLETCKIAKKLNIHIELTYLIIPTYNDKGAELTDFCKWVLTELDAEIPVHFTRFHPEYKMRHLFPTPLMTLDRAYNIAKNVGLKYVYIGNVPHSRKDNTYCPNCSTLLIERYGFYVEKNRVKDGKCPECNTKIPIVGS